MSNMTYSLNGVSLDINELVSSNVDGVVSITPKQVIELAELLSSYKEWYKNWSHEAKWFDQFSLPELRKQFEEEGPEEETGEYMFSGDFAPYYSGKKQYGNHDFSKDLKKKFEVAHPEYKGKITFDSEYSCSYFYSKDMDALLCLVNFVMENYVKPVIDEVKKEATQKI